MELNIKTIAGGIALFVLGGFSVYLITRPAAEAITAPPVATAVKSEASKEPTVSAPSSDAPSITGAESFYEAAEARREQQLINKEESDRIAKLTAIKARSVECKFWKQQQKTSSAAAKIEEKIIQHCTVKTSSSANSESASSDASSESVSSSS